MLCFISYLTAAFRVETHLIMVLLIGFPVRCEPLKYIYPCLTALIVRTADARYAFRGGICSGVQQTAWKSNSLPLFASDGFISPHQLALSLPLQTCCINSLEDCMEQHPLCIQLSEWCLAFVFNGNILLWGQLSIQGVKFKILSSTTVTFLAW